MKEYNIAVIAGDGVGPEIISEGIKVLDAVADLGGIKINYEKYPHGAEHYIKTGEILPDKVINELKDFKAIYFGSVGDPRVAPSILEVGLVLKIRFELDQYINLRPIKLYPNVESPLKNSNGIDFYVVRENTEDFYNGMGAILRTNGSKVQKHTSMLSMKRTMYNSNISVTSELGMADDYGLNIGIITSRGAERAIRYAFKLAEQKGKKKVTSVDKYNVLPHIYGIWREAFEKVSKEYPEVDVEYSFVDAIAMWFVKDPAKFDVVVAPNLFGDIITDLAAGITGGLGFAAGANINPTGVSMFEPIHGSAPKYKGLNVVNPIATILSGCLLLENIGELELGHLVEEAVKQTLIEGHIRTKDMGGTSSTTEMGEAIAAKIYEMGDRK